MQDPEQAASAASDTEGPAPEQDPALSQSVGPGVSPAPDEEEDGVVVAGDAAAAAAAAPPAPVTIDVTVTLSRSDLKQNDFTLVPEGMRLQQHGFAPVPEGLSRTSELMRLVFTDVEFAADDDDQEKLQAADKVKRESLVAALHATLETEAGIPMPAVSIPASAGAAIAGSVIVDLCFATADDASRARQQEELARTVMTAYNDRVAAGLKEIDPDAAAAAAVASRFSRDDDYYDCTDDFIDDGDAEGDGVYVVEPVLDGFFVNTGDVDVIRPTQPSSSQCIYPPPPPPPHQQQQTKPTKLPKSAKSGKAAPGKQAKPKKKRKRDKDKPGGAGAKRSARSKPE